MPDSADELTHRERKRRQREQSNTEPRSSDDGGGNDKRVFSASFLSPMMMLVLFAVAIVISNSVAVLVGIFPLSTLGIAASFLGLVLLLSVVGRGG
jgi:hypothetical protein